MNSQKPKLLDLFCGAGGATRGYQNAGFYVVGVDREPMPNYCGDEFVRADALEFLTDDLAAFDAIHASPPCQAHTAMGVMWNAREHHSLIGPVRDLLVASGLPYVIENVPGAPLENPVAICGASLGLATGEYMLARHRLFECSFPAMVAPCAHGSKPTLGVYGDHARDRRRVPGENPERGRQMNATDGLRMAREAMGMGWANWRELSQAIPPAYTEHIGGYLMAEVERRSREAVSCV